MCVRVRPPHTIEPGTGEGEAVVSNEVGEEERGASLSNKTGSGSGTNGANPVLRFRDGSTDS